MNTFIVIVIAILKRVDLIFVANVKKVAETHKIEYIYIQIESPDDHSLWLLASMQKYTWNPS